MMNRAAIVVGITCLSIFLTSPISMSAKPLFDANRYYLAGDGPSDIEIGDVDGDGIPDLVTADQTVDSISVLPGVGDGTFLLPVSTGVGDSPASVILRDLDLDGILDAVTANKYSNDVSVLQGNGDGTFLSAGQYTVGEMPQSVDAGDLNGDGNPDLVTANNVSGTISILLGQGDGSFQDAMHQDVFPELGSLVLGHLDNDQILDVAVTVGQDGGVGGAVIIGRGNGDGSFSRNGYYPVGDEPSQIAIGDIDGDGHADLATENGSYYSGSYSVSVLLSDGSGRFEDAVSYSFINEPHSIVLADLNGDGRNDLVMTVDVREPYVRNGDVLVQMANPDGTFQPAVVYPIGEEPLSITAGDLDGDGDQDLVSTLYYGDIVSVLLGNGDGTFPPAPPSYQAGRHPTSIAAGDFDNNGIPDLAVGDLRQRRILVLMGNGNGTFQHPVVYDLPYWYTHTILVTDLDSDGNQDLVTTCSNQNLVSVLMGDGDGTFQPAVHHGVGEDPRAISANDVNGDGMIDLTVANFGDNFGSDDVSVLLGQGDGTFQPALSFPVARHPQTIASGDLDGDGHTDLAVPSFNDNVISILYGNGDGTFQAAMEISDMEDPRGLALGDINADGNLDLVACYRDDPAGYAHVSIRTGNGDGSFEPSVDYRIGGWSDTIITGDLDSDGHQDLVSVFSNWVSIQRGNGDGTFEPVEIYQGGYGAGDVALIDANADGAPDLATADAESGRVSILINRAGMQTDTVSAELTCTPDSGTLPFSALFRVEVTNLYQEQTRRFDYAVDVTLAGGGHYSNWRRGYQNVQAGQTFVRQWTQTIPHYPTLEGVNSFRLFAADVTPAPWNQPPYPPAGDTNTGNCTVTGSASR